MAWPLSHDYNEAVQSPATSFADPDLKRGEAVANALGIPMPFSGNFADVYQVRCPDGSRWAVKCFTREAPGLRERYQEISRCLRRARLPFMVDFSYLAEGINIGGRWLPVLKMQWVEGLTLNQFVRQSLDRPVMLEALLQIWVRMGKYLRAAGVAHCDLQHGNVLLVPGANANSLKLKLIDYDGMWVPALAGSKSGEVGHPSYQHPQRLREGTYSPEVDRFPLLLVATALRALATRGRALWDRYDNGDNLLFKEKDLRDPGQSALFQELSEPGDPATAALAGRLRAALGGDLQSTPLLEEGMPEARVSSAPSPAAVPLPPPDLPLAVPVQAAAAVPMIAATAAPVHNPWDFEESAPASPDLAGRRPGPVNPGRRRIMAWIAGGAGLAVALGGTAGVCYLAMKGAPEPIATPSTPLPEKPTTLAFSPAQIPGLQLWLQADKGLFQDAALTTPAVADGDPVGGWQDQSGNGNHTSQSTNSKRPTLKLAVQNALPVVRFDGVDDILQSLFTLNQPCTLFCVFRERSTGQQNVFDGGVASYELVKFPDSTHWDFYAGTDALSSGADVNWHVAMMAGNGPGGVYRFDGAAEAAANMGANNPGGLTLAAAFGDNAQGDVDVGEVLFYSNVPSAPDRIRLFTYLNGRWEVY